MSQLNKALWDFQKEILFVKANRKNDFTKSKFAKLIDVKLAIDDTLVKHGLSYDQNLTIIAGDNCLTTTIYHTSGEEKLSTTKLVNNSEILKWGASITYQRRYQLMVALGLVSDDDDDGKLAQANETKKRESLGEKRLEVARIFKDRGVTVFDNQLDQIEAIIGKRKIETLEEAMKVIEGLDEAAN